MALNGDLIISHFGEIVTLHKTAQYFCATFSTLELRYVLETIL